MLIVIFIFGLIVGSFLNAVIHRLWVEKSITWDRSHCPKCNHVLSASDLVPLLSFLLLRGRCRYCNRHISWQYPLVELATALSFTLAFAVHNLPLTIDFWLQIIFICIFIVIGVFDFKHYLILDKVVFPSLAFSTVANIYLSYQSQCFTDVKCDFYFGVIGALVISGFFLFQYVVSKGRWIGFGDVKLGLLLGSVFGLSLGLLNLAVAYFLGAIVGVTLIALGRKQLSSQLPFGTFLATSAIIILIYGQSILDWYLKLIGF